MLNIPPPQHLFETSLKEHNALALCKIINVHQQLPLGQIMSQSQHRRCIDMPCGDAIKNSGWGTRKL